MHTEAHAGLGWLIGNLPPSADRRLRNWCLAASLFPDVDTVTFLFGPVVFGKLHHTFGHNVFVGAALTGVAAWHCRDLPRRRRALIVLLVALCFGLHLAADAKFSAYAVYLFWPLSQQAYEFSPNFGLASPINSYFVYASLGLVVLLALLRKVTPVDALSPRLDRLLLSPLRPKPLECAVCGRRCSDRCETCGAPTCLRHSQVSRSFRITCGSCSPAPG